jgi:Zn-dependent protease with chaperone function
VKYRFRPLLAVGPLVGFYVVALAIVAALVYVGFLLSVTWGSGWGLAGGFWILAVVVATALGRPLFSEQKVTVLGGGGLVVGEADQPRLWHEVRELAGFAATRPPDEIQLVAAANAGVAEETSLLGLVGGTRKMSLGAPLLVGLSREQLRAVLAHELGHYSGRHTALDALTYPRQGSHRAGPHRARRQFRAYTAAAVCAAVSRCLTDSQPPPGVRGRSP